MIIAHDLGTTGDKAALYTDAGSPVDAVTASYGTDFGPGGKAEQAPRDWWEATCHATRELLAHTGVNPHDIGCIAFSGQMMGAVFLDDAGTPVRPAIIWADTRSTEQCQLMLERMSMERAYAITGHRLNPTYSLTKILWVRDNEPESFARTQAVVQAKDYIAYRLTGRLVTDPSDASSTNAFDQRAQRWSEQIITAAELSADLFPEVVPSTTVIGTVGEEAATSCGLVTGIPVVIGGGDGPCAAAGTGAVSPTSRAYTYLGSSSWVSFAADAPLYDPEMRTMTFNHVVPDRFVPTATMQAGGASLEWVADILDPDDSSERYAQLLEAAADVPAADDGLYFLPHLLGERSPYWNPRARAVFAGLARHHHRAHLVRAVLEGVAMNLYTGMLAFRENGTQITNIDAIGGAAVGNAMLRILADVWGIPIHRRNLVEANSLGAAIVGGVGVGNFENFDVAAKSSHIQATAAPDLSAHSRYAQRYPQFIDAYSRLETWFDAL